jgi:hypothetical protein
MQLISPFQEDVPAVRRGPVVHHDHTRDMYTPRDIQPSTQFLRSHHRSTKSGFDAVSSSDRAQPFVYENARGIRSSSYYGREYNTLGSTGVVNSVIGSIRAPPPLVDMLSNLPARVAYTTTSGPQLSFSKPLFPSTGVRRRSGNPTVDGLVGVEPNPGPPKHNSKSRPAKRNRKEKAPHHNNRRNADGGWNRTVGNHTNLPATAGTVMYGSNKAWRGLGTHTVLGSTAHIFEGHCAIQNIASNGGGGLLFQDIAGGQGTALYCNPRICCQNSGYSIPSGACPISVMSQPFRKYSFRTLKFHYVPLAVATTMNFPVAFAYDPEVITTSVLGSTVMNFANFEASVFGPVWKNFTLDVTPFLDKSKWYFGETPGTIATSLIASQSIQGTLLICSNTATAVSTQYGMLVMEFTIALSELGPTEVYTAPALAVAVGSSSSSAIIPPTPPPSAEPGSWTFVAANSERPPTATNAYKK